MVEGASHDLSALSVGILGMGSIGLTFANYIRPFGMKLYYHNRNPNKLAPSDIEYCSDLYDMLKKVDVLSVHIPLSPKTKGFIGDKEIRTMKKGSIIVNTARGAVIDEEAMIKALQDGHVSIGSQDLYVYFCCQLTCALDWHAQLASVGLDVFTTEPKPDKRLLAMENVSLLPHVGTENRDARTKMEVRAITNIKDYLTTGVGENLVAECQGIWAENCDF
jgi:glyoxylate reductase